MQVINKKKASKINQKPFLTLKQITTFMNNENRGTNILN